MVFDLAKVDIEIAFTDTKQFRTLPANRYAHFESPPSILARSHARKLPEHVEQNTISSLQFD
jgi:hypothetical protein